MAKYHVNKHGEPDICKAEINCPLGGEGDHIVTDDINEARAFAEKKNSEATGGTFGSAKNTNEHKGLMSNPDYAKAEAERQKIEAELDEKTAGKAKSIETSEQAYNKLEEELQHVVSDELEDELNELGLRISERKKEINALKRERGIVQHNRNKDQAIMSGEIDNDALTERTNKILVEETLPKYGKKRNDLAMYEAEKKALSQLQALEESRGEMVLKGEIQIGNFAKGFNQKEGIQGYYDGPGGWNKVQELIKDNWDDWEPGTGSVDGDVRLVNLPADGFRSSIVEITDENRHLVQEVDHVRRKGEKPVSQKVIQGEEKPPAKYVQAVVYRADVLGQDDARSTDAEWEVVAINTQQDKRTPMHPTMMARNANQDEGGTYREYTDEEWKEAHDYWDNHAYIEIKGDN